MTRVERILNDFFLVQEFIKIK